METVSYKCPNCGGELVFDPKTQKYKCDYCVSVFESVEQTHTAAMGEAKQYHCPSCGAEIITDTTTAASHCYYCHNPVMISGRLTGEYLPDKIIPFAIDEKEAKQKFLDFVQTKRFIPKAFFDKKQMDQFSGVYFPYWIYGCTMEGKLSAKGTKTRVWRTADVEYTEHKFYQIDRNGFVHLDDITKYALNKANRTLTEGVLPYNYKDMKEFQMSYLSGFMAEKRDIEKSALSLEVDREVQGYGKNLLRDTVQGYSGVSVNSCNLIKEQEQWSYVLLPIWTLTYRGENNKLYYYSMNGQTGQVHGELPVDYIKIWLTGILVGLLTGLICLLGGYLI